MHIIQKAKIGTEMKIGICGVVFSSPVPKAKEEVEFLNKRISEAIFQIDVDRNFRMVKEDS